MKNFYEATVIKPALKLDLQITLRPLGSVPCKVLVNGNIYYNSTLIKSVVLPVSVPLTDPVNITVQIDPVHPDAVDITVDVDDYEILPLYQEFLSVKTCYLDNNNVWSVTIPNFYPWLHGVSGQGWIA